MAIRCLALALILLAASACASRQETPPPAAGDPLAALRTAIDAALGDSALARSRAGIKVVSLTSGEVLYERDSHLLFHPASNMKLLSTAIALQRLGTDYSYRTLVGTDSGAAVDSVVRGPLYLKGFGNPDLIDSDLRGLAETLRRDGIRRVDGPLVCDATYFDDLPWGYGWMWDDVSAWYWAPISALTVNDNCVEVTVAPGDSVGAPLNVSLVPETAFMAIDDLGSTVAPDDSAALEDFSVQRQWRPIAGNVVEITGGMAVGSRPRTWTIDVVDAPRYTGNRFLELLAAEGIAIRGGIEVDTMPESAQLLAEHRSEPLTDIVINTNKVSDNLSAEALLKSAGAAWQGPPGTAEKGISAIYAYMDSVGIDSTSYRLADGSGVSRYNVITPELLVALLEAMAADYRVAAEYKTSLPIAGVDGTLRYRMRGTAAEGKLRAKTGTLSGVSSLSGYTTTADGEELAFSMIMEHFVTASRPIRDVQDRIGALLSGFSRTP